jgi:glycosyltransferase involved in cell wall biosynthesis
MFLTVILCTHNPRVDYLQRTLGGLKNQTLEFGCWELLLIDNACTKPLAASWDLSWHPNARHIREEKLGLTNARIRGINESNGDLIVYVDDDNLLDINYLKNALELMNIYTNLGCIGSADITPEFEIQPNDSIKPYLEYICIRSLEHDEWSFGFCRNKPWGAGLVIRQEIGKSYIKYIENNHILKKLDRSGDLLFSGGDDLFTFVSFNCGKGVGVFKKLKILHLINKNRLTVEYFQKLMYGGGYSAAILSEFDGSKMATRPCGTLGQLLTKINRYPAKAILSDLYLILFSFYKNPLRNKFAKKMFEGWNDGLNNISKLA